MKANERATAAHPKDWPKEDTVLIKRQFYSTDLKNTKATRGKMFSRRLILCVFVFMLGSSGINGQQAAWDSPIGTCWSRENNFSSSTSPASDNTNTFYLPKSNRTIQSYSAITGGLNWSIEYGGDLVSSLHVQGGELSFAVRVSPNSSDAAKLRIFKVNTQSGLSRMGSEFPLVSDETTAFNGDSLVKVTSDGALARFGDEGARLWATRLSGSNIVGAFLVEELLVVFNSEGDLWVVDAGDGQVLQKYRLQGRSSGSYAIDEARKRLYAGSVDGNVYALDLSTGATRWSSRTGAAIESISLVGSDLLVTSSDNFVYRLADGNGRRLWKRRLAGRILGGVLLGDEFGAFLSLGTRDIVILRLRDGKVVNRFEVEGGDYFTAPPLLAGGRLIIQTDTAVTAIAPIAVCPQKENEDAARASSL